MNRPFQLAFADGTIKQTLYKNIETVTYGALLHKDPDKIKLLSQIPESVWMAYTCPFVLEREKALLHFRKILVEEGLKPYKAETGSRALVAYLGCDEKPARKVTGSPYWSNLVGADCSTEETAKMVMSLSEEELVILALGTSFFLLLCEEDLPKEQLFKMIDPHTRLAWGDFHEAAKFASRVVNPGFSSKVRFSDDRQRATVRVWPNILGGFIIDQPQIAEQIEIVLVKINGSWMVHGIVFPSPEISDQSDQRRR